jgi:hypothetical protein
MGLSALVVFSQKISKCMYLQEKARTDQFLIKKTRYLDELSRLEEAFVYRN